MKRYAKTAANASTMPYSALLCAVAACEGSEHASDRRFASQCLAELQDRLDEMPTTMGYDPMNHRKDSLGWKGYLALERGPMTADALAVAIGRPRGQLYQFMRYLLRDGSVVSYRRGAELIYERAAGYVEPEGPDMPMNQRTVPANAARALDVKRDEISAALFGAVA